jgi:hypothetical protein
MDDQEFALLLTLVAKLATRDVSSFDGSHVLRVRMSLDDAISIAAKVSPGPYQNKIQQILIDTFCCDGGRR